MSIAIMYVIFNLHVLNASNFTTAHLYHTISFKSPNVHELFVKEHVLFVKVHVLFVKLHAQL